MKNVFKSHEILVFDNNAPNGILTTKLVSNIKSMVRFLARNPAIKAVSLYIGEDMDIPSGLKIKILKDKRLNSDGEITMNYEDFPPNKSRLAIAITNTGQTLLGVF